MATTEVDRTEAQAAVARATSQVGELLRTARRPATPALGRWDVTDVAVHLSHALDAITAMAEGGGGLLEEIGSLSSLTERLVDGEEERDLLALADRIEASASRFLALETGDEDSLRTWLVQGTEVPLSVLTCHALNELVVHGRDMAVAEGVRWPIARSDAALIVCGFLFPVLGRLGDTMVDQEGARGVDVTYDVRVRGGCRATLHIRDGDLSVVQGETAGRADCRLSVDPAGFLLVAWGRVSQWEAIARGQLLAWGRRPWMGVRLRKLLQNP